MIGVRFSSVPRARHMFCMLSTPASSSAATIDPTMNLLNSAAYRVPRKVTAQRLRTKKNAEAARTTTLPRETSFPLSPAVRNGVFPGACRLPSSLRTRPTRSFFCMVPGRCTALALRPLRTTRPPMSIR